MARARFALTPRGRRSTVPAVSVIALTTLLVSLVVLGVLAPSPAGCQPTATPDRVFRIGVLPAGPIASRAHQWAAFRAGLQERGYVEGQNVRLEFQAPQGEGGDRLDDLAARLLRGHVDLIVAVGDLAIQAARRATDTIPIVMIGSTDPVSHGLVASLARPGANVTGLAQPAPELSEKPLELLREIVPGAARLAVLWNPRSSGPIFRHLQSGAPRLGVQVLSLEVVHQEDLEKAVERMVKGRAQGLLVLTDRLFDGLRARIAELALKHRVPAVYTGRAHADAGGLIVYGPSEAAQYRQAATFIDRILKGAPPAEVPVEQPTAFELIVNLKTARALGLTIPPSLLARADRVIQ